MLTPVTETVTVALPFVGEAFKEDWQCNWVILSWRQKQHVTYDAGPVSVRAWFLHNSNFTNEKLSRLHLGEGGNLRHLLHESFNLILVQNKSNFDTFGFDFFGKK